MRSILIQVLEVGDLIMQMLNRCAGLVSVFVLSGKLLTTKVPDKHSTIFIWNHSIYFVLNGVSIYWPFFSQWMILECFPVVTYTYPRYV